MYALTLLAKCNCTGPLYKTGIPRVECLSALLHKVMVMETTLLGRWSEVSGGGCGGKAVMREGKDADSTLSNLPLRSAETGNIVPKKYYFFNPF